MTAKKPDRLFIDTSDKSLYDDEKLVNELFYNMANKEKFLFAMAYGFKFNTRVSLNKREGYVRAEYLSDTDRALINSLSIYEKEDVTILSDPLLVFQIAEEYAHAGIRLLHDNVNLIQHGSFYKHFEGVIHDMIEKIEVE
jgi:hypothetical protein